MLGDNQPAAVALPLAAFALGGAIIGWILVKLLREHVDSASFARFTNTILPIPADPDALQGFALGVKGPGISGAQNLLGTGISIPAFGTFIQAIARTGDTDLLSTPHILALDNEDAEINVGDNVPVSEISDCSAMESLAHGAMGMTSVGLNAVLVVMPRIR